MNKYIHVRLLSILYVVLSESLLLSKELQETGPPDITTPDVRRGSHSAELPLPW